MADFKFPVDGTKFGRKDLVADETIDFPPRKLELGSLLTFEIRVIGATVKDDGVQFKFFSGLSFPGLDASNVVETVASVNLTGLTGNLTFLREIVDSAHSAYRIVLSGTDPTSNATFLIRVRSIR